MPDHISYPYNAKNLYNGKIEESTIAFGNYASKAYQNELASCNSRGVPRIQSTDPTFKECVERWGKDVGLKWTYSIYRELWIIPSDYFDYCPPHSYAAGNAPVFCAGLATFGVGATANILTVNYHSGHYMPTLVSLRGNLELIWGKTGFQIELGSI